MLLFVKISNGSIEKYPYTVENIRYDFPQTSFPSSLENCDLSEFDIYKVSLTEKPNVDYTNVVEEQNPELVDGTWTQVWSVRSATAEEQSAAMTVITRQYTDAIQEYLDQTAQTKNYATILSACSYAAGNHPKYSVEGQACLVWREAVWDKCYEILNDVQTGVRPPPTLQQVIAELPQMVWPTI